jgi:hypothetical protein
MTSKKTREKKSFISRTAESAFNVHSRRHSRAAAAAEEEKRVNYLIMSAQTGRKNSLSLSSLFVLLAAIMKFH